MITASTKLFAIFLAFGAIVGLSYKLMCLIEAITHNKYINAIFDFAFSLCAGVAVIYMFAIYNSGIVRLHLLAAFAAGIAIVEITLKKMFANLSIKLYNGLRRWMQKLKKSKFMAAILK